jgi:hypothetical protein
MRWRPGRFDSPHPDHFRRIHGTFCRSDRGPENSDAQRHIRVTSGFVMSH